MAERFKIKPSTIPLLAKNWHTVLSAANWPVGIDPDSTKPHIVLCHPGAREEAEMVVIGDAESEQGWAAIGAGSRNEIYSINLDVIAGWRGQTAEDAMTRAFELLAVAELEIRNAPTLGVDGGPSVGQVVSAEIAKEGTKHTRTQKAFRYRTLWFDDGFKGHIETTVGVFARI